MPFLSFTLCLNQGLLPILTCREKSVITSSVQHCQLPRCQRALNKGLPLVQKRKKKKSSQKITFADWQKSEKGSSTRFGCWYLWILFIHFSPQEMLILLPLYCHLLVIEYNLRKIPISVKTSIQVQSAKYRSLRFQCKTITFAKCQKRNE